MTVASADSPRAGIARPRAAGWPHDESTLAQCFDALPSPIAMTNASGLITFYNRAAFQYYGPRIAWAKTPAERDPLFHPNDLPRRRAARDRVLRQGERVRVELRALRVDYRHRWHLFDLTPLFDAAARVFGMLIVMTDIHDTRSAG